LSEIFIFLGEFVVNQIEFLREKLYREIEAGDISSILKASQELDKLILIDMEDKGK